MDTTTIDLDATDSSAVSEDVVVGVYRDESTLADAVKHLEAADIDMAKVSVIGRGMKEERHVIGFETKGSRTAKWAGWGGLWGWLFAAFWFVPGIGHLALGGYLLTIIGSAGLGAAGGALTGALTSAGIPEDGIPKYVADLKSDHFLLMVHGTAKEVVSARGALHQTDHERVELHTAETQVGA